MAGLIRTVTGGEARGNLEYGPHALAPFRVPCLAGPRVGRPWLHSFVTDTCRSSTPCTPSLHGCSGGKGLANIALSRISGNSPALWIGSSSGSASRRRRGGGSPAPSDRAGRESSSREPRMPEPRIPEPGPEPDLRG